MSHEQMSVANASNLIGKKNFLRLVNMILGFLGGFSRRHVLLRKKLSHRPHNQHLAIMLDVDTHAKRFFGRPQNIITHVM